LRGGGGETGPRPYVIAYDDRQIGASRTVILSVPVNAVRVVSAEIVHHDNISAAKRGNECLTNETKEELLCRRTLVRHHGAHAIDPDRSSDRQHPRTIAGDAVDDALTAEAPRVGARHVDGYSGLVQINHTTGGDLGDGRDESRTPDLDSLRIPLLGDQGLFFRVNPRAASARTMVERLTGFARLAFTTSRNSNVVQSG
jgi:hypothetical protein